MEMEGMIFRGIAMLMFSCMVVLISTVTPVACGINIDQSPSGVEEWFDKRCFNLEEKKTKLHFYFHDKVSGTSPTAVPVAHANMTATSPTGFGTIFMIDDPLTVGPDPNSTEVGRAQGIYTSADLKQFGFLMTLNLVFTSGEYNGSTLSVLAHNPVLHKYREMPIVGGTGAFRLARGIATAHTYFVNFTLFDAIVEYHAIVIHY